MRYRKQSRLERIAKRVLLLPLLISAGCGTINRTYGKMVPRGNNIVAPANFDLYQRLTKANRALIRFPDAEQINQAVGTDIVKSVDKYLIPGARYLLIHARQAHFAEDLPPEKLKKVREVQTEIYLLSEYLTKSKDVKLRKAHDEGITSKAWADILTRFFRILNDMDKYHVDKLKEDIRDIEYQLAINQEDRLEELLEEKRRKLKEVQESSNSMIKHGAILKLGAEKKLKVLPAEKERYGKHKKELSIREKIYEIELREDAFLEIASKQRRSIVYVVFGGSHAWGGKESCGKDYDLSGRLSIKDNLAVRNRKNPRNKSSLIELTLTSYDEYKEQIKDIKKALDYKE